MTKKYLPEGVGVYHYTGLVRRVGVGPVHYSGKVYIRPGFFIHRGFWEAHTMEPNPGDRGSVHSHHGGMDGTWEYLGSFHDPKLWPSKEKS